MSLAGGDPAADTSGGGGGGDDRGISSGGGGGSWREGADIAKTVSDGIVNSLAEFLARHGWTMILLVVVWYNCKDPIMRRYRKWRNKRSLAEANRPDRRAVLDRERARAVAEKQREALEAARAAAARKKQEKMESYAKTTAATAATKEE